MATPPHDHGTRPAEDGTRSVGPVTLRLIHAVALIPIVPALSFIGTDLCITHLGVGTFDELRWFSLLFSILWVAGTVIVWRSIILWTLGRRWLTALIGFIPFIQVIHAQPLWHTTGCLSEISDGMLRLGQHEIGVGVWVWLTIWVWWGWEKRQMSKADDDNEAGGIPMTPTAKRVVASIGSIPIIVGCFWIIDVFLGDVVGFGSSPSAASFALTALVAILVWILIWRRWVVWSGAVIKHTIVAAVCLLALPIAIQWVFLDSADGILWTVLVLLPVIGWGAWMAATVGMWQVRSAEASGSDLAPHCLNCGYLLKGLRATRCPECGDERTLDELWQATVDTI